MTGTDSTDPTTTSSPAPEAAEPTGDAVGASGDVVATLADTIVDATTPDSGPENRPEDGAVLRYGTVTAVGTLTNLGKVQTSTTGVAWVVYDVSYGPKVGDLVYIFQQGPVAHVGGKLGGTQPTPPPVGVIHPYAGATAPTGWLVCNGAPVSRTTYPELFAVCGTTFGSGDGSTTFNIPNLTDRVPTGIGSLYLRGETGGSETRTLTISNMPSHDHTATQGSHDHTGTALPTHDHAGSTMPQHDHTMTGHTHTISHDHTVTAHSHSLANAGNTITITDTAGTTTVSGGNAGTTGSATPNVNAFSGSSGSATPNVNAASAGTPNISPVSAGTPNINANSAGAISIGNTGGGTAFNNMPPYLGILYILRALP
jgi:microcystin-dependent protein